MSVHEINLAGRISHFFAVNRPLSVLLLLVSLVFGLVSFFVTPKQYNPEIVRPAFAVSLTYQGATVDESINRVVYELVEKIDTVPGVDDVYTEVHDGARINTTVIFEVGYDATKAKLDLLTQLNQHSYLANGNIATPQIIEINPETIPVLQLAFGSADLSISELRQLVTRLSQRLGQVPDVSEMQVYGGYQAALVVEVNPDLLQTNQLSFADVQQTLQQSQERVVTTGLHNQPYTIDLVFDGVADSAEAIGNLVVREGVQIRDVAKVYEGVLGARSYVFYQDKAESGEVVLLSVAKVEGSSAPVVTKAFLKTLSEINAEPEFSGLQYKVIGNDGATAETEILGLTKNLISSILIVAVVLLLFLSMRAAAVVLVAIPVTLLVVFGLGFLFHQTINRITLFALILSLGLLVDSAIVAVENMYAHLRRYHAEPTAATRERVIAGAIDEIGVGLLLSMLTSVIVFLPMNYITGMMGPYMGPIAFFVPAALMVSFLVAIVVTPFVANHLLRVDEIPNRFTVLFSRVMESVTKVYVKLLRVILYNPILQKRLLLSAVGVFLLTLLLPLFGLVHFQMLPKADRDQFYVYVDLPVGTDREETKRVTSEVATILLADADVRNAQQFIATPPILDFNGMFKGAQNRSAAQQATIRVNLTPAGERKRSSTDVVDSVRHAVTDKLPAVVSAVRYLEEPPGPPVRATFVAKVATADATKQRELAAALESFITKVPGVVDTYVSDEAQVGRVRYNFDYAAAEKLGVSPKAVSDMVQALGGVIEVAEFKGSDSVTYTPIVMRLPSQYLQSPNVIDSVTVMTNHGKLVPLRSVLMVDYEARPATTYMEDVGQLSYVTAEVEDRSIVYVVIEVIKRLTAGELSGYTVTNWNLWSMEIASADGTVATLTWGGEWEMTLENFRDLGVAMGVALLMVYALLVAQYNTFSTPAYILVTIPLGLVGILWGFFFLDVGFSINLTATALIGFIALIGLVVNNAIIFLEYVEQARTDGLSYRESLIAAGEARLRPIFLTSLTTVLGSLTIASDPVWSGLAWAIIFGLSLSTILTLIMYPTLLVYFNRTEK
ncbi:MAG: hypothetical protein RLZZ230_21 [Candidatus Parcubacteria bacterium]|jgi:multidrug efflux pump subunit AcrB